MALMTAAAPPTPTKCRLTAPSVAKAYPLLLMAFRYPLAALTLATTATMRLAPRPSGSTPRQSSVAPSLVAPISSPKLKDSPAFELNYKKRPHLSTATSAATLKSSAKSASVLVKTLSFLTPANSPPQARHPTSHLPFHPSP